MLACMPTQNRGHGTLTRRAPLRKASASRLTQFPIVKHVVDGLTEAALGLGYVADAAGAVGSSGSAAAGFAHHTHAHETRPLEEGIDVSHRRQRLDPGDGASLAGAANERRGDTGAAISGMQHDARQDPELRVPRTQSDFGARISQHEKARTQLQTSRRRAEDADADGFPVVPEQHDALHKAELVTAVMPPSEVRPVGSGAVREPKVVREANRFF